MQRAINVLKKITWVLVLHVNASACKPASGSDVQSLDNLARSQDEALNVNDCRPDVAVAASRFNAWRERGLVSGSVKNLETLRTSLGGIDPVLDLYFSANYKIEISNNAAKICAEAARSEQGVGAFDATEKDKSVSVPGCWTRRFYSVEQGVRLPIDHTEAARLASQKKEISEEFVIVLNAKDRDIKHAALRLMGFVTFQRLSRLSQGEDGYTIGDKSAAFSGFERQLALSVLSATRGKAGALAPVRHLLPRDLDSWSKADVAAKWSAYEASAPAKAEAFGEYAAAESFDSYYHCKATRRSMQKNFAAAHGLFKDKLDPELRQLTAAPVQVAAAGGFSLQSETPAYGLCGGGLFPNLGCGQIAAARQERFGAVFPRLSWAWGNPSGCGLFIRRNC